MKTRKYDALSNVPWQVRADIREEIEKMPDGNDKTICKLYFVQGMTTPRIARYCTENELRTRVNSFYTVRSIQYVIAKHFPEVKKYRKPNRENEKRRGHFTFIREHKKERCGMCGSQDRLEWHHMIPLDMGGKSDEENMICLCKSCHETITSYHRKMGYVRSNTKGDE